jgi:uncharacterized protein
MKKKIGVIKEIYRYPVKSMASERLASATLGLRGIEGDRRFAFMISENKTDFPFLTGSKYPGLIGYKPYFKDLLPRVITPGGEDFELQSDVLLKELSAAFGSELKLVNFKNGIFDEAEVSLIGSATIKEIEKQSGHLLDIRRFRPNIVMDLTEGIPFQEDQWVGKIIAIGKENVSIAVTMRDLRCVMINIDPDTQASNPEVLKTVGRLNQACAGVYSTVVQTGTISVGDELYLH